MVTETSGNGYALYNGVKLPNIDSVWTDKETYLVATMFATVWNDGTNGYMLYLSQSELLEMGGKIYAPSSDGINKYFMYAWHPTENETYWEYVTNGTQTGSFIDIMEITENDFPHWTNSYIVDIDDSGDELAYYLEASDPIPLDGMTVIEWSDVNIDELEAHPDTGWYKIAEAPNTTGVCAAIDLSSIATTNILATVVEETTDGWILRKPEDDAAVVVNDSFGVCVQSLLLMYGKGLVAYTSVTVEPEAPTHDPTSMLLGWLTGERVKAMLRSKREPVAYLYNGVRLPKLPEWDKEAYPYAVIYFDGKHRCYVTDVPVYFNGTAIIYPAGATMTQYFNNNGSATWGNNGTYVNPSDLKDSYSTYIWANYDILNEDGSVYLKGSEPIPVYE